MQVYAGASRERIHALVTGAKSDEVPPFMLDTADGPFQECCSAMFECVVPMEIRVLYCFYIA